jgi:hypothetical protein
MKDYQRLIAKVQEYAKQADNAAKHATALADKVLFRDLANSLQADARSLRLKWFEIEDMLTIPTVK